jgi:hypothetical protein
MKLRARDIIIIFEYNHQGMQKSLLICLILVFIVVILSAGCIDTNGSVTTATTTSGPGVSSTISTTSSIYSKSSHTITKTTVQPASTATIQTKFTSWEAVATSNNSLYTVTCFGEDILCGNLDNAICINPSTDPSNCGGCGIICRNDQSCIYGSCVTLTTPPTFDESVR